MERQLSAINKRNKNVEFPSSSAVSKIQKQKQRAAPAMPNMNADDQNHQQPSKIRKLTEYTASYIYPTQLELEDPLAYLNQSNIVENIPNSAPHHILQIPSTSTQKSQLLQSKEQIAQVSKKKTKAICSLEKVQKLNQGLRKFLQSEDKCLSELIEKQEIVDNRTAVIQERTNALKNTRANFQETIDDVKEMYNNVILPQDERIKNIETQYNDRVLKEKEELRQKLIWKERDLTFLEKNYHTVYPNEIIQWDQNLYKMDEKLRELKGLTGQENRQKRHESIKKYVDYLNELKGNRNGVKEEYSRLLTTKNQGFKKYEELIAKFETLQFGVEERQKCEENLESSVSKLAQDEQGNLKSRIEILKNENLAIISGKDSEIDDYKNQMQDLSLTYKERTNKMGEIDSDNEKWSKSIAVTAQETEELKKVVTKKDHEELKKLGKDFNIVMEKSKELSTESERLDKKLIDVKDQLNSQIKTNLKTRDIDENDNDERESELRKSLVESEKKLKSKIDEVEEFCRKMNDEELKSDEILLRLKQILENKNQKIIELRKIRENLKTKKDAVESETNRKLEQLKHLSMQCQGAGHEKQIEETDLKIDILEQEISAAKLKFKQGNIKFNELFKKDKEERYCCIKEMKSDIEKIEKVIPESKGQQKKFKETLKNVQRHNERGKSKSTDVEESLNWSRLVGSVFTKHESIPTSSTPEHSPNRKVRFNVDSSSELSSISGSDIFEDREREFANFTRGNRNKNANLN